MPGSTISSFTDPDDFSSAVRGSNTDLLVTARGDFHAEVLTIDLNRLWMLRNNEPLPAVVRQSISSGRVTIMFRSTPAQGTIHHNSKEFPPDALLLYGHDSVNHFRMAGPFCGAAMSLSTDDLAATGEAILGRELAAPRDSVIRQPPLAAIAHLSSLHEAACSLARTTPDILAHPEVATSMEQALIRGMIACLSDRSITDVKPTPTRHARIISKFQDYLAARRYQPVHLPEVCTAVGASERTLRACCEEHFGMGPIRYLWLRRMHLARRALLRASAATATVTSIATELGFWELGRFSVEYRALFGESPREALRRPSQHASH